MNQTTSHLMMVRPAAFGFNEETASSNLFQHKSAFPVREKALMEFDAAVEMLSSRGIDVVVFEDLKGTSLPDSIFPNNWVTFHHNGIAVLYPMATPLRRKERRPELLDTIRDQFGFRLDTIMDLTHYEQHGGFLEGTGSMVFDHPDRKVYMARSIRSSEKVLHHFCKATGYDPVVFNSIEQNGTPVYHTNVLLSVGIRFAVVCTDAVQVVDRKRLLPALEQTDRQIIEINPAQMLSFCGNILEVKDDKNQPVILVSDTAIKALLPSQKKALEHYGDLLPVHIPTIEQTGGGGIRCMVAEIFMPKKSDNIILVRVTGPDLAASCFDLRWRVLREPWHQPRGSEKDDQENQADLYAAMFSDGKVIGTGRVQMNPEGTAQIRYMAVDPIARGKGVGKALLVRLEEQAKTNKASRVILQARENALPFYLACGYRMVKKSFLMFGEIQHFLMEKDLK